MKQEKDLKKVYVFSNQFGGNIVYLNKKYLLSISYTVKSRLQTGHPFAIIGPQMYMFIALYFKNHKILHQNIKFKKKKKTAWEEKANRKIEQGWTHVSRWH